VITKRFFVLTYENRSKFVVIDMELRKFSYTYTPNVIVDLAIFGEEVLNRGNGAFSAAESIDKLNISADYIFTFNSGKLIAQSRNKTELDLSWIAEEVTEEISVEDYANAYFTMFGFDS
jgi:hypothetical protein